MKKIVILLLGMILIICSSVYSRNPDVKWIGDITIAPASPMAGINIKIEGTFRATLAAVDNLRIDGGIDRTTLYTNTFPHIDQGVNTNVSFNWTATSGNHTAWFKIDPDNTIGDSDLSNNRIEKAFVVSVKITKMPEKIIITTPPPLVKPDLIVQNLEVIPAAPRVEDVATLRITIKNIGGSASSNCGADYHLITQVPEGNRAVSIMIYIPIPGLDVNGTFVYERAYQYFKNTGAGIYKLYSMIDVRKEVNEMNEDNNTKYIEFTVAP